jgi:hypothetical protein
MNFVLKNTGNRRRSWPLVAMGAVWLTGLFLVTGPAASDDLIHNNKIIHPACVYALTNQAEGDELPVTLAVSIPGCEASPRSQIKVSRAEGVSTIEDQALLGEGTFSYNALSQLNNGIYAVAVRRVGADGNAKIHLAAIDIVERSMLRSGIVMKVPMLELLGLRPLPQAYYKSFRRVDNKVHVRAGSGANAVDRVIDLTALGKARKKGK